MNRSKKWQRLLYVSVTVYILLIVIILLFLKYLPSYLGQLQRDDEIKIQNKINEILKTDSSPEVALQNLYEKERIELVVIDKNNKIIFKSIPFDEVANLKETINNQVVGTKMTYQIEAQNNEYFVWLTVYFSNMQTLYNMLTITLSIVILLLFASISTIMYFLYRNMVNPLKLLNNNIQKLKQYNLKQVVSQDEENEYASLSKELYDFAKELDKNIGMMETGYSQLEQQVSKKQQEENYKAEIIRGLIHDLKTPVSTAMMQVSSYKKRQHLDEDLNETIEVLEAFPDAVNEIMFVLNKDYDNEILKRESLDVVKEVSNIVKKYKTLILENDVNYELVAPQTLFATTNKFLLNQIVGNAISNATKYIANEKQFTIEISESQDNFVLRFINDSEPINEEDLENVFKLFRRIDSTKEGSGSGLFIVKTLVEHNNGSVTFTYKANKAVLEIYLPKA